MKKMILCLCLVLALALASVAGAQSFSWSGGDIVLDCDVSATAERRCMELVAAGKLLGDGSFVCTAAARANGRCPDTITVDQNFPHRDAQQCTEQDIPGARGRCRYGRGPAVSTFTSLPTCDAGQWGHIALVEDEAVDYLCDGSTWAVTASQPEVWRPTVVQCGTGPTHDVWPDGGPLLAVGTSGDLPPCVTQTDNLRAWVGATDPQYPHVDGVRWRCQFGSGGWGTDGSTYREDITDAGINAVCRGWANAGGYWILALPSPGPTWVTNQAKDVLERWLTYVVQGARAEGRAMLSEQQNPLIEE